MSSYESGELTKRQAQEQVYDKAFVAYNSSMDIFVTEYGFRPVKVFYLEVNGLYKREG
jgi:hypothetical protein